MPLYSLFRVAWELFIVCTILVTLINLPVSMAFFVSPVARKRMMSDGESTYITSLEQVHPVWYSFNAFMDVAYFADIILTFRTGYVDSATEKVTYTVLHTLLLTVSHALYISYTILCISECSLSLI